MTQHDQEHRALIEVANTWRAKLSEGNLDTDERQAFETWLKQDIRHEEVFDQSETYWSAYDYLAVTDLDDDLLRPSFSERVTAFFDLSALSGSRSALAFGTAALACIAVSLIWIQTVSKGPVITDAPVERLAFASDTGEVKVVSLPDGSEVTLAARSEMRLTFSQEARVVTLVKGAALFDVHPDPDRPFSVISDHLSATVLGTQFEVSESAGKMRVAVREGLVDVAFPLVVDGVMSSLKTHRRLAAGDIVSAADEAGLTMVRQMDVDRIAAWRNNILYYEGATLGEIVDDANRYSEVEIRLSELPQELRAKTINASFQATDLDALLDTLTYLYPIAIDRSDADEIVIWQVAETE
ncbi:MAG: FecR domain-containing protein [Henriciella sp.]|jgi:transmembrane sensor